MATKAHDRGNVDQFTQGKRGWLDAIVASPVLWGAALTAGFYAAIPHLPWQRELVERYCTGHILAYVETTLFLLGVTVLCLKMLTLGSQKRALKQSILESSPQESEDSSQFATRILMLLQELPGRIQRSYIMVRLGQVCRNVRELGTTKNLYDHQQYLADVATERLHESYSFVRTITWAVPILGFLGTVMGITIAIANVQPEQLKDSMDEVTGGLGIAFDTTTRALGLTLVLVFLSHWIEKAEQKILHQVDEFAFNRMGAWFPEQDASSPLLIAEQHAAEQLIKQTETLVAQQTDLWQTNIEQLRTRWSETLEIQQTSLTDSLTAGAAATLNDHASQLAAARSEILDGYRTVSQEIAGMLSAQRQAGAEQQLAAQEVMEQQRKMLFDEIATVREELRLQTEQITGTITGNTQQWTSELSTASGAMTSHLGQLQHQSELLSKIVEQEENLTRLQESLSGNLNAIRAVDAFDETLHNLSAAVHLLTVRTKAA